MKMHVHRRMVGDGPWLCYFCGDDVAASDLHVHHIDHNHKNNVEGNVVTSHEACHIKYHNAVRPPATAEQRAAMTAHFIGVPKSEAQKSKMSKTANNRPLLTCECGRTIKGLGPLRRHQATTCGREVTE